MSVCVTVWLIAAMPGCGGSNGAVDAGPIDMAVPRDAKSRCDVLEDKVREEIAVPGSCASDDDCSMIGGQDGTGTCDCAPSLLNCAGVPIERNAPGLARARTLAAEFHDTGCFRDPARPQTCDCAPRGPLRCNEAHRCDAVERFCNLPPPDAAVDAPPGAASPGTVNPTAR